MYCAGRPGAGVAPEKYSAHSRLLRLPGGRLGRREAQRAGRGVVAVLLEQARGRLRRGRAAASGVERGVRPAVALPGERVARDLGQAVQVLGAVVRAEVRPVAPERAVLHEAVLEEDLLPALDVRRG